MVSVSIPYDTVWLGWLRSIPKRRLAASVTRSFHIYIYLFTHFQNLCLNKDAVGQLHPMYR